MVQFMFQCHRDGGSVIWEPDQNQPTLVTRCVFWGQRGGISTL
jgi:hypothetical protein